MEKKKKVTLYLIATVLYIVVGIAGFYVTKKYFKPEAGAYDTYVIDSVEISDEYGLRHVINSKEPTYALITGEFQCNDPINDVILGYKYSYSYIDVVTIDSSDEEVVETHNIRECKDFNIYGVTIDDLNFDNVKPSRAEYIEDIRNKDIVYIYYVKGTSYYGTLLCKIDGNKIEAIKFYENKTINHVKDEADTKMTFVGNGYLVIWALILFILLIEFDNVNNSDDIGCMRDR